MANEPLLPSDNPPAPTTPPEPTAARRSKITCEFCRCELVSSSGDVLKMSPEAKAFRDQADRLEAASTELTNVQNALADAQRTIEELKSAANPPRPQQRAALFGR